ncbi:MAG TPA: hypothetical protein VMR70_00265, partial [Flavisolibacter sp.]|nr:hypothetical protein [Flavisolibacter sp.]
MAAKLWHKAPFIRLLLSFSIGILLQWHLQAPLILLLAVFGSCLLLVAVYSFTGIRQRFQFSIANGIVLC